MINAIVLFVTVIADVLLIPQFAQIPTPRYKKLSSVMDLVILWPQSHFPLDREFCAYLLCSAMSTKAKMTMCPSYLETWAIYLCYFGILVNITIFHWQIRPSLHNKLYCYPVWAYIMTEHKTRKMYIALYDFKPWSLGETYCEDNKLLLYHLSNSSVCASPHDVY